VTIVAGDAYISRFNGGLRSFQKLKIEVMPTDQCAGDRIAWIVPAGDDEDSVQGRIIEAKGL
jgi:hypothetical protein